MCDVWAKREVNLSFVTCSRAPRRARRAFRPPNRLRRGATALKLVDHAWVTRQRISVSSEALGGVGRATWRHDQGKRDLSGSITAFDKSAEAASLSPTNTASRDHHASSSFTRLSIEPEVRVWINKARATTRVPSMSRSCSIAASAFFAARPTTSEAHGRQTAVGSLKRESLQKIFARRWAWPEGSERRRLDAGGGDVLTGPGERSSSEATKRQILRRSSPQRDARRCVVGEASVERKATRNDLARRGADHQRSDPGHARQKHPARRNPRRRRRDWMAADLTTRARE